jgi:hypothetical protein
MLFFPQPKLNRERCGHNCGGQRTATATYFRSSSRATVFEVAICDLNGVGTRIEPVVVSDASATFKRFSARSGWVLVIHNLDRLRMDKPIIPYCVDSYCVGKNNPKP